MIVMLDALETLAPLNGEVGRQPVPEAITFRPDEWRFWRILLNKQSEQVVHFSFSVTQCRCHVPPSRDGPVFRDSILRSEQEDSGVLDDPLPPSNQACQMA